MCLCCCCCRLVRAASTHAGKTSASAAMMQAAASLAAQQQQQQVGLSASSHPQSPEQRSVPALDAPQQGHAHSFDATWHGPARTTSISVAAVARHDVLGERELLRDMSWHGRTSHMQALSEQDAMAGSKRANEHEEFLKFLETVKRQRQEQRKVARLVLEGSVHGGVQYFLPARATRSVAVPSDRGQQYPASGPSWAVDGQWVHAAEGNDDVDGDVDVDEDDDDDDMESMHATDLAGTW